MVREREGGGHEMERERGDDMRWRERGGRT